MWACGEASQCNSCWGKSRANGNGWRVYKKKRSAGDISVDWISLLSKGDTAVNLEFFRDAWSADAAMEIASWCWYLLAAVWLLMRFSMKKAKKKESFAEFVEHAIPAIAGFWLIFERSWKWPPLRPRLLPDVPAM